MQTNALSWRKWFTDVSTVHVKTNLTMEIDQANWYMELLFGLYLFQDVFNCKNNKKVLFVLVVKGVKHQIRL